MDAAGSSFVAATVVVEGEGDEVFAGAAGTAALTGLPLFGLAGLTVDALFRAFKVLAAILAKMSFSNPPTVTSSDTRDSTDKASSPTTEGTAASLESMSWSKSPSTLVSRRAA